jgi:hypothetical protein
MKNTTKNGLMLAGIQILLSLLFFGLGLEKNETLQIATTLFTVAFTIYLCYVTILHFRDMENNGYLSIWEGIKKGVSLTSISGMIMSVYFWIYAKFLNPELMEYMRMKQEMDLEERGLSQQQIEQSMAMAEKFSGPLAGAIFAYLGAIFLGLVFSLIIAAILKKERADNWQ